MLSTRQMNMSGWSILHLIEVEGAEEAVPPAERGVGVDDDVGVRLGGAGLRR